MHGPRPFINRTVRAALSLGAAVPLLGQATSDAAVPAPAIACSLDLPDGQTAKVFSNGTAAVFSKDVRKVEFRAFPVAPQYDEVAVQTGLPDKARLIADLAGDFFNFCAPPTIVAADLGSGALSSFSGVTSGFPYGMAVDSVTNKAVVPTICDGLAGIYDLGAKTGITVHPQGTTNLYPAIDQTRGLIVMDQVVSADFGVNNNAMSSAVVMDERGNVLATLEQFLFFNTFLSISAKQPAIESGDPHRLDAGTGIAAARDLRLLIGVAFGRLGSSPKSSSSAVVRKK